MKKTGKLRISALAGIGSDRFVINPNDGFDLGLLTRECALSLCTDIALDEFQNGSEGRNRPASVELRNECPQKTLQVDAKTWKGLGMPDTAEIHYDGKRIFLHKISKL